MHDRTRVDTWGKVELYEYGRRMLGYGDWSDLDPDPVPYPKWVALEAHKLNATMKRRKVTNTEFVMAVDYCKAMHIRIENPHWVFHRIADAKAAQAPRPTDIQQQIDEAIACEQALAATDSHHWIARLTRARGPFRIEAVNEWRAARNRPYHKTSSAS